MGGDGLRVRGVWGRRKRAGMGERKDVGKGVGVSTENKEAIG